MATKANHHFIPQFYLRGFADGVGRKARVFAFDFETAKTFKTLVRNVGSKRHFNRIEVANQDPNALEDALAEVETLLANHLEQVIQTRSFPSDEHFNSVMNLYANIHVRNPRLRSVVEGFHQDLAEKISGAILSLEERWTSVTNRMRNDGYVVSPDISYGEMKRFHERKNYDISIDQTYLIGLEVKMLEPVLRACAERRWCLASAPEGQQYICSDDPAILTWFDESNHGAHPPGHGMKGTAALFPLSSELLLIGAYDDLPSEISHTPEQVTAANTQIARHANTQIYARDEAFAINVGKGITIRGSSLANLYDK